MERSREYYTKESFLNSVQQIIESLYDYDLYATQEIVDLVEDVLPYNVRAVPVPDSFLPDNSKIYLIKRSYLNY